jgi:hypothetical protein
MRPFHPALPQLLAATLLAATLAACSGEAFVDRNYTTIHTSKDKLPGYNGSVSVCYTSETPRATRDEMAQEACAVFGLQAQLVVEQPWQCRLTVPHLASYTCGDPSMRNPDGTYVNPTSKEEVERWKKAQRQP